MRKIGSLLCLPLLFVAALALADATAGAKANDTQIGNRTGQGEKTATVTRTACLNQCNSAEVRCSSEVRRARQECSRRAATAGRDPMNTRDYTYFCSYFGNQNSCGSGSHGEGCRNRLARAYGLCIDRLRDVATMRHDCHLSERDAQNFCRSELRDCRQACDSE